MYIAHDKSIKNINNNNNNNTKDKYRRSENDSKKKIRNTSSGTDKVRIPDSGIPDLVRIRTRVPKWSGKGLDFGPRSGFFP